MTQERKETLGILFAQYPDVEGFYLTSDNQAFSDKNKNDAVNHSKTLEDKKVDWCEKKPSKQNSDSSEKTTEVVKAGKKGKKADKTTGEATEGEGIGEGSEGTEGEGAGEGTEGEGAGQGEGEGTEETE